ncbi:MAG: DUF86 domain-containing protein [Methyloprofundus sp.]|nr:DUF86 domain-containing protein [Methyloprofundus sp.]
MKDRMIYIHAAYDCIQSIEEYIHGYQLESFLQDKKTQDAVIRNLEVLGQTIKDFGIEGLKMDYPHIPWSQISGMRNIIAHEYLGLDSVIIWETVKNHLQPIRITLEEILQLH